MATILLSAAGAALGSGIGGTVLGLSGSVVGRAIGGAIGRSIDQRILGSGSDAVESGRVERFRISGVGYGVPMREVWGRMRVAGEVIWASRFDETVRKSGGGKGSPRTNSETFSYSVSIAIALCKGEATSIGRIWADGVEIAKKSLNIRFYPGSETQLPDPKIEAVEGTGLAPSYRGTCYVMIEDLLLSRFGNRVPQFSFEVVRPAQGYGGNKIDGIQDTVRAVALIPGSGEYSLATKPVNFNLAPGRGKTANVHSVQEISDFRLSLNQMTDELPNCGSVSLVVSWFGNDLRCGNCIVQPKVEQNAIESENLPWIVSGVTRDQASVVPSTDGRPIYGGTPTDQSVIDAIQAIRSDGKAVMFYPFILMDQMPSNGLTDPWTGDASQPALPWRGRITLNSAPGTPDTSDQSMDAQNEISTFLGAATTANFTPNDRTVYFQNPSEWGYRRFILHYAHLCATAGGVDAFCVGSELRGLTQIRSAGNTFPMVTALRQLCAEVKSILGPETKVSYAADWSEYFGYHVGDSVLFNLDPLWADENVDFVGIDNYMPISDWRDGAGNIDREWESVYNIEYLLANIAGGEGFDWYYDSVESEDQQRRRPIEDLIYDQSWVFRYKDIKGWWSNNHHDRILGIKSLSATAWSPGMKPIWFTEYGCAALNKATNQPNKFIDSKSSESALPRDSTGERDDVIQMQYLRAMSLFWRLDANNPTSLVYSGPMVDMDRSFVWAWDARPFPEFPGNQEHWSDGVNYARGHWLNGRSTNQQLSAVISELCNDLTATASINTSKIYQSIRGYEVSSVGSSRSKLQSLSLSYGFDTAEIDGVLMFRERNGEVARDVDVTEFVHFSELEKTSQESRSSTATVPGRVRLSYIEAENDFEVRSVEAVFPDESSSVVANSEYNLMISEGEAQAAVDRWLAEARLSKDTCRFSLAKSSLGLNSGDVISIFDSSYRIDSIEDTGSLHIEATRISASSYVKGTSVASRPMRTSPVPPSTFFSRFLDLPLLTGSENPQSPHVAVALHPWPGPVAIWNSPTDSGYSLNTTLQSPAILGMLTSELFVSRPGLWDRGSNFSVKISSGDLSSVSMMDVLNGSNVVAIGDGSPENWEIIQFTNATLVAPDIYEISNLLRGLLGTDATAPNSWPAGSLFVVIDSAVPQINLPVAARGLERFYRIGQADKGYLDSNATVQSLAFNGIGLRPYSVCHLTAIRQIDASVAVKWIRRTRIDGDSWQSSEVPLGEEEESYTIRVQSAGLVVRELIAATQSWVYTPQMQIADSISATFAVLVAQNSNSFGLGPFVYVEVLA